jgi:hypothetical protein
LGTGARGAFGRAGIHREKRKGCIVARKRPSTSEVVSPVDVTDEQAKLATRAGLTCAEAHALRRSTPLTPGEFKALRRLAQQGVNPLRHL